MTISMSFKDGSKLLKASLSFEEYPTNTISPESFNTPISPCLIVASIASRCTYQIKQETKHKKFLGFKVGTCFYTTESRSFFTKWFAKTIPFTNGIHIEASVKIQFESSRFVGSIVGPFDSFEEIQKWAAGVTSD